MKPKISVIITIYNSEKYIFRCIDTLFNQTLEDIEYIFVDDGSTDSSMDIVNNILEKYEKRKKFVKIIRHDKNQGISQARISGINQVTGDYVIHCDSDDYIELNMYETMYEDAIKSKADIVCCFYSREINGKSIIIKNDYKKSPNDCVKYFYKKNNDIGFLWNKLVRTKIIRDNYIFPIKDIDYAEDLYCVMQIFHYAKSLSVIKYPFYHYCSRVDSFTSNQHNSFLIHIQSLQLTKNFLLSLKKKEYLTTAYYFDYYIKFRYKNIYFTNDKEWFYYSKKCHRYILKYNENPVKVRLFLFCILSNYFVYKMFKYKFNSRQDK